MLNQMNDDAAVTVVRDGNITQVARGDGGSEELGL